MTKFQVNDSELNITAAPGHVVVTDHRGQVVHIREQSMAKFEEFYKLWALAMAAGGMDSFVNAWVYNQQFRHSLIEACQVVGLEEPEQLTVAQLEALLLNYTWEDGSNQSILFRLHNTYPKLPTQDQATMKTLVTSLQMVLSIVILMLQGYFSQTKWGQYICQKLGHCLELCLQWLSSLFPGLFQTPHKFNVYENKNGELKLKKPNLTSPN